MPAEKTFNVRVYYNLPSEREPGQTFGTFMSRQAAEECLIAVSQRSDVKAAKIEEVN